ncbi:amidohydrolase [Kushneria marisflavi]|uniref:Omega-amidase YafV n=1 Tax=Kushneria marisflavi TaxID=157779 RepID=A0A240UKS2_9GAMM|nr:amidohydrolase [Kushneria marisflavi]ART61726.1 amidohydrolase [Kushneria marisflavi]RKD86749.1 putative amidohydrolase [Kushneria marisflavi]
MSELRTTLVQADLRWEDIDANCHLLDEWLQEVTTSDLIVLPEMFATGFTMAPERMAESMQESRAVAWMQNTAQSHNAVVTGSVAIAEDGHYFNRLIWARPDGTMATYDKRHLFRMGEENEHYAMGNQRALVSLNGFNILLTVCYDLRFPVWLRNVDCEYDVMLCVANWPSARRLPWRTLLQARAIENSSYVIGVNRVGDDARGLNYSGDSMLIDYRGDALIDEAPDRAFVRTGVIGRQSLEDFREKFPVHHDADRFTLHP